MDEYIDTWDFSVSVHSIGLDMSAKLKSGKLLNHVSLRLAGFVTVGEPLIEGTSVYANFWAGDDDRALKVQSEGAIGIAVVSKDVSTVRRVFAEPSEPIAGINITVALSEIQFGVLRDHLALADASGMTVKFGCVGEKLMKENKAAMPVLLLNNKDAELRVVSYEFCFSLPRGEKESAGGEGVLDE